MGKRLILVVVASLSSVAAGCGGGPAGTANALPRVTGAYNGDATDASVNPTDAGNAKSAGSSSPTQSGPGAQGTTYGAGSPANVGPGTQNNAIGPGPQANNSGGGTQINYFGQAPAQTRQIRSGCDEGNIDACKQALMTTKARIEEATRSRGANDPCTVSLVAKADCLSRKVEILTAEDDQCAQSATSNQCLGIRQEFLAFVSRCVPSDKCASTF